VGSVSGRFPSSSFEHGKGDRPLAIRCLLISIIDASGREPSMWGCSLSRTCAVVVSATERALAADQTVAVLVDTGQAAKRPQAIHDVRLLFDLNADLDRAVQLVVSDALVIISGLWEMLGHGVTL
jgi:hypothetical protein